VQRKKEGAKQEMKYLSEIGVCLVSIGLFGGIFAAAVNPLLCIGIALLGYFGLAMLSYDYNRKKT